MGRASATPALAARGRRPGLGGVGAGALIAAWAVYLSMSGERRLRAAVAEADRLDPGWRFAELEAARAKVPDDRNGALVVTAAAKACAPPATFFNAGLAGLVSVAPNERIGAAGLAGWKGFVASNAAGLAAARPLLDRPAGRFDYPLAKDVISTYPDYLEQVRLMARLASFDGAVRADAGDFDGSADAAIILLHAAGAIGDDPFEFVQLNKMTLRGAARLSVQRLMAQGEVPADVLERLQARFEATRDEPSLLLACVRGERAAQNEFFEAMRRGDADPAEFLAPGGRPAFLVRLFYNSGVVRENQAWALERMNDAVERAKRPDAYAAVLEWASALRSEVKRMTRPEQARLYLAVQTIKVMESFLGRSLLDRASTRCLIATIAAERFRLAKRRWPESWDELSPKYLKQAPDDPFGAGPLKLTPLDDGLAVTSIEPSNNPKTWVVLNPAAPGSKVVGMVGYRLWDPSRRRVAQAATPVPPSAAGASN